MRNTEMKRRKEGSVVLKIPQRGYGRVVTRYIFSSVIPNFSPKFGSLIPKMWQYLIPDPVERFDQVSFPDVDLSFINNNKVYLPQVDLHLLIMSQVVMFSSMMY